METVQVLGLRELREALVKKVPFEMQGKTLQKALVRGARPIVDAAKRFAPGTKSGKQPNTGILKASIHSEKDRTNSNGSMESRAIRVRSRRGAKRRAAEQGRDKSTAPKTRTRGSGAPYWWYVEFGTRHQKAQRFMSRGFDTAKFEALEELRKALSLSIVDAIRKARFETPRR